MSIGIFGIFICNRYNMVHRHSDSGSVVKSVKQQDKAIIMELAGDIDLHHSVDLRQHLLDIMEKRPCVTIVNMSQVAFMDSSGLATLVEALQLCRRYEGELRLVGMQPRVRSIFEISRLDSIFKTYDSEAEALAE